MRSIIGPGASHQEGVIHDETAHPQRGHDARAVAVADPTVVAACGSSTRRPRRPSTAASEAPAASRRAPIPAAGQEPVTIIVGALRPGATQEAVDALNLQISEFEAKYPWISVEPEEYNWTAPTFTAALAAGTLPDVFTIPFTDGKGLIAQDQIVNIDERVRALGYADKFNPNVLVNGQDADGAICAVPTAGLRHVAHLQPQPVHAGRPRPDQAAHDVGRGPRRGQDHRREDRRRRLRRDGHREHRRLAARPRRPTPAAAGWSRSATTARSPRPSTTTPPRTPSSASRRCAGRTTRWARRSTTPGARSTRRSPPARSACSPAAPTCTRAMVQNDGIKPEDYGVTIHPARRRPTPASSAAARSRRSTSSPTRPSATPRSTGSTSTTCRSCSPRKAPSPTPRRSRRTTSRSACPPCRSSTRRPTTSPRSGSRTTSTSRSTRWRRSRPQIFDQPLVTEPVAHTQELYAALDPVVQAVLTDKNADIDALLDAANAQVQAILDAG